MLLALSIIGPQGADPGSTGYKVFDTNGGSIGRLEGNDWILADAERFVSTRHASIAFVDGAYRLTDLSTNGTFLNAPDSAVDKDGPVELHHGDRLFIGNYEILVQLIDLPSIAMPAQGAAGPEDLLVALGLDPKTVDPAIYASVGNILRIVVQGLMEMLQARAQVKSEFRMDITHIRPFENNPLKFSRNVPDALQCLFGARNPGYLPATEAFREAFDDLASHEMAVLAGVRAAFDNMLAGLHPDRLEAQYARRLRRASFIRLYGPLRYWALYRAQFQSFEAEPDVHFQSLFGEEFARAYAEQLDSLQAVRQRARQ